jgi:hypothetical protein
MIDPQFRQMLVEMRRKAKGAKAEIDQVLNALDNLLDTVPRKTIFTPDTRQTAACPVSEHGACSSRL